VPKPPRERPRAWAAGSPSTFFCGAGRSAAAPDGTAVDAPQVPVDAALRVQAHLEGLQEEVESARFAEGVEAVVDGLPLAVAFGQVAPGGAGVQSPEDAVEDGAVVLPLAASAARSGRKEGSK
jgi:hypothetical protein